MSASPAAVAPKRRPWGRRFAAFLLAAVRHSPGWILRIFFTLLVLLAVLFAYLHLVGLPAYFTDLFLDRMAAQGYHLQIQRLTLEIDRGLVARNVRLYAAADAPEPFLEAKAFTVAVNPVPLLRRREVVPVISIVDGAVRVNLGQNRFGVRQGSRAIAVDRLNLRFSATRDEIQLREFSADILNIHFQGRGVVYPVPGSSRPAGGNPLAAAIVLAEEAPDRVLRLVEQINEISFQEPPTADFTFALYPAHPEANSVVFRLDAAAGGSLRGIAFDQFSLDLAWKDQQLRLPSCQIQKGPGILGFSGWFDLANQTVSLHLLNTLPPDTFLDLLPDETRAKAAAAVADYRFPLRLELQIGPCPLATAAEHFTGRISFSKAKIREVPVESLDLTVAREGPEVRLDTATVQLDRGTHASRLKIRNGAYHLVSKRFRAEVAGTLNPHLLKPLMTPGMRAIVEWFGLEQPVEADIVLGGVAGNPAIYCYGPVQATNFSISGVAVTSLQGQLNITNEVMHLTGATLARPEGRARGDIHLAFSNQTIRLDLDSTLDARDTAQMIGPGVADFMQPFQLNGPVRLQARGLLDFCNFALNHLEAHVEAQRFGFDRWEADRAVFDLGVRGRRLRFTNIVAAAYGGQFTGTGRLYPVGSDDRWRYEVDFAATNVNLTNLLFASTGKPTSDLRGTLDGTGRIGGYIGQGTGATVTGAGRAAIRGGLLFQTRLFSGLSAILSRIIPDFTLFAQTDAAGNYTLRNGRLVSRDIELKGTVFSVKAAGHYTFAGELDYRVEVQLLRSGPVAAIVRLATRPVTRLLEFRLTGTFDEPRWRPLNLNPAELFSAEGKPES